MRHFDKQTLKPYSTCDRCDDVNIFTQIMTPSMFVELCVAHTKQFTGLTMDAIEAMHAPYENHLAIKLAAAYDAQLEGSA